LRKKEKAKRGPWLIRPEKKRVAVVYFVLRILVLGAMIRAIMLGNYENAFVCLLALALFLLPGFVEKTFRVELPDTMQIIILCFIFAAEILGEIECYYLKYPFWDTMLHTTSGFLFAAIGFSLVDVLNQNDKLKFNLSPIFMAVVAFCFSMTIGVLWEFFEFSCDRLFQLDMQKDTIVQWIASTELDPTRNNISVVIDGIHEVTVNGEALPFDGYLDIGLIDTMSDLFVNFIGAVVFSVIGYFFVKHRGKGRIARQFIPVLKTSDSETSESGTSESDVMEP
jgi:hypothetical protein